MLQSTLTESKKHFYTVGLALQHPLSNFHGRVVQSLESLPSHSGLQEIVSRIAVIMAAPLVYPTLGALALMGRITAYIGLEKHIACNAKKLSSDLANLKKDACPNWQQEAMSLVRKSRYDDPWAELQRLKATQVLTDSLSNRLDLSINQVNKKLSKKQFEQIKAIMAQALEIKSIYGTTHHVFIHAQASNWLGLTYLVKELEKTFEPDASRKHFKFLRPPFKLAEPGFASSAWNTIRDIFLGEREITNVREYIRSKWYVRDSDGETREHLLSADGYFLNAQRFESSLYFLVHNSNILGKPETIKYFYKQILSYYLPSLDMRKLNKLASSVFDVVQSNQAVCGNLFVLCIPKKKSSDIQYRAHPFGVVCKCHPEEMNSRILNDLQNERFPLHAQCSETRIQIPQYRIYTPMLKAGETPVYLLTPHAKTHRKAMKKKIREIIKQIANKK